MTYFLSRVKHQTKGMTYAIPPTMEFHPRLENKLTFRPGLEFLILPVKQLINTSAKKSESSSPIAVADA